MHLARGADPCQRQLLGPFVQLMQACPQGAINDLSASLDSEWRGANNFCSDGYKTFTLLLRGACTPSHGTGAWISLRNIQ